MHAIGGILPNKREIIVYLINSFAGLLQWSFLGYAQIQLLILYSQGADVFDWNDVKDAKIAWFITIYLITFNIGNILCNVNTYITLIQINSFIESKQQKRKESALSRTSSFFFDKYEEMTKTIESTLCEIKQAKYA